MVHARVIIGFYHVGRHGVAIDARGGVPDGFRGHNLCVWNAHLITDVDVFIAKLKESTYVTFVADRLCEVARRFPHTVSIEPPPMRAHRVLADQLMFQSTFVVPYDAENVRDFYNGLAYARVACSAAGVPFRGTYVVPGARVMVTEGRLRGAVGTVLSCTPECVVTTAFCVTDADIVHAWAVCLKDVRGYKLPRVIAPFNNDTMYDVLACVYDKDNAIFV